MYFECNKSKLDRERILRVKFYDAYCCIYVHTMTDTSQLATVYDPFARAWAYNTYMCMCEKQLSDAIFVGKHKRLNRSDADWSVRHCFAKIWFWPNAKIQSIISLEMRDREGAAIITASKMIFKNNFSTSVEVSFASMQ